MIANWLLLLPTAMISRTCEETRINLAFSANLKNPHWCGFFLFHLGRRSSPPRFKAYRSVFFRAHLSPYRCALLHTRELGLSLFHHYKLFMEGHACCDCLFNIIKRPARRAE